MFHDSVAPTSAIDRVAFRLLKWLTLTCDVIGVLLLAGVLLMLVAAVAMRDVLGLGLPWTEEMASMLAIYAVGVGSLSAWVRGEHLAVDLFSHRLPKLARAVQFRLCAIISCGFFALAAWGAWLMAESSAYNRTVSLGISFSYLYYGILIGFAGMTVLSLWQALRGEVTWRSVADMNEEHPDA
ncbi:TRAP transporter small permease [Halomonas sp. TRM85114]|uniref:TRAP transporter small permease n=1 Tax=Halomonas jincaotanensis TaxID=2810616 RepID=UPI001BD57BAB|nr:TRAP transporter small permease subunit [Halomonas jincaotanensis]MBS9402454.1 TRAP transporter small permease [Halomonas jincaotanensis]